MDIQIEHLDKAYGENQVLKDFSAVIPEEKLPVSWRLPERERRLC